MEPQVSIVAPGPAEPSPGSAQDPALQVVSETTAAQDLSVSQLLLQGTPMIKVSASKQKTYTFRIDPDEGQLQWESKTQKIVPIEAIKEIRSGSDARYYREQFRLSQDYENRWLTIIYILDGNYKTLHIISSTEEIFRLWDATLRKLHAIRQTLMSGLGNFEMRQKLWENQYWKGADQIPDKKLDFDEVERMCRRLNINSSTEALQLLFKKADSQNQGFLDINAFRQFAKMLKARPEIDRLYQKLCSPRGRFDFPTFEKLMREYQRSSLPRDELERIFAKYATTDNDNASPSDHSSKALSNASPAMTGEPTTSALPDSNSPSAHTESSPTAVLTVEGFTSFLLSQENSAFTNANEKVFHDMTRPLSEYYISSSHNTYLVGHQLVGVSTIEGYIRALLHSCRSVELDVYDGDPEPVVYHGKTFTSKVPVREICRAIAKYAFVASSYPVIISAEVHCGPIQQDVIFSIMTEVFGDALVNAPIEGRPKITALPSPEDLKGRFLLKAKSRYTSEHEAVRDQDIIVELDSSTTETSDTDIIQDVELEWHKAKDHEQEAVKGRFKAYHRGTCTDDGLTELKQELQKARNFIQRVRQHSPLPSLGTVGKPAKAGQRQARMSFKLASLLVYTVGVKCRGINKKEAYAPEHVFSLSENTANKMLRESMVDLIKHTRQHIVRTYPKGLRLNSSNYLPHRFWSGGAQLVAINWQTFDLGYMINHAMFQRNGRSGYVLKPLGLRSPNKELLSKRTQHLLEVTIISAQQLPRPKDANGREIIDKSVVDPFVEVSIHIPDWSHSPFLTGAASPGAVHTPPLRSGSPSTRSETLARTLFSRTGVVRNNGFNPVWEEDICLPFDCAGDMLDLIFVRFAVKQEDKVDGEPLALYCTSLGSLEMGFRHLPLHDAQLSQYMFSTLFVRIAIRDV